jgi:hypothetical protein
MNNKGEWKMSEEFKHYTVYPEAINVKARNDDEAQAIANKFYQLLDDDSYFRVEGPEDIKDEPMVGPGCYYDISLENKE